MEGPRACRVDELPALRRLQNAVFRPRDGDMFGEYPHMYGEHNVDNLRITTDGGRVVSCVGMTQRWALLEGCAISCCLIGGVCTDADYRERGLATACLRDVLTKARADGVDLGLISGGRGMYLREGARRVGREWGATLDMAAAERVADSSLTVATWEPDREMAEVAAMYDREPVRWLRPLDDYRFFARSGFVIDWACTIGVVRRAGAAVAYMLVSTPDEEGGSCLFEYAGERDAVAGALAAAMRERGAGSLGVEVLDGDLSLRQRLEMAGAPLTPATPDHTALIVNFPSLMERLRPHFASDLGAAEAARLAFREEANDAGDLRDCVIERDGEEIIRTDRADMVCALFGGAGAEAESAAVDLGAILPSGPLPLPPYGLNYV